MMKVEDLNELKEIYLKLYKRVLNDEDANYIATGLVNLYKVIAKPIPEIDKSALKGNNESND